MYKEKKDINKKVFLLSSILFAMLVIIAIVLAIINALKSAKLTIKVAPSDAMITLNGEEYKNGTYSLFSGEYDIVIKREGFEDYKDSIQLNLNEQANLYVCMTEENGNDFYASNSSEQYLCEQIEEYYRVIAEEEKFDDPIYSVAPYHDTDQRFYIDPYTENDGSIAIKITAIACLGTRTEAVLYNNEEYKEKTANELYEKANNWLLKKNIKLDNYIIKYVSNCDE